MFTFRGFINSTIIYSKLNNSTIRFPKKEEDSFVRKKIVFFNIIYLTAQLI